MTQQHGPGAATVEHTTMVFEREVDASVATVFEALADARARAVWGVPSATATLLYDDEDFREGGQDHFRCGSKGNPNIHGTTQYLQIVRNVRIASVESIRAEGRELCVSLNTLELSATEHGTAVKLTVQLASLVGPELIQGHQIGHESSMNNLVQYIRARSAA